VVTKVEVEENVGDDVVDVKVDESEVNVDVEEEEEKEAVVAESIFVVVSMRKLGKGHDTNRWQLSWTSCKPCGFFTSVLLKLRCTTRLARAGCPQPGVTGLQPMMSI
jgi:hypothetical protein